MLPAHLEVEFDIGILTWEMFEGFGWTLPPGTAGTLPGNGSTSTAINWEGNEMPSTAKTKTLRLNQFVGSDKPKMDDFNYDNTQLETVVGGHLADAQKHLTSEERKAWSSRPASCSSMTATEPGGAQLYPEL